MVDQENTGKSDTPPKGTTLPVAINPRPDARRAGHWWVMKDSNLRPAD